MTDGINIGARLRGFFRPQAVQRTLDQQIHHSFSEMDEISRRRDPAERIRGMVGIVQTIGGEYGYAARRTARQRVLHGVMPLMVGWAALTAETKGELEPLPTLVVAGIAAYSGNRAQRDRARAGHLADVIASKAVLELYDTVQGNPESYTKAVIEGGISPLVPILLEVARDRVRAERYNVNCNYQLERNKVLGPPKV